MTSGSNPSKCNPLGMVVSFRMIWFHLRIHSIPFHHSVLHFGFSIVSGCLLSHMSLNMMTSGSNPSKCNPLGMVVSSRMIWFHLRIPSIELHHQVVHFGFSNVPGCLLNHMSLNMMPTHSSHSKCNPLAEYSPLCRIHSQ